MTTPRRTAGIATTCVLVTLGLWATGCGEENGPSNTLPAVTFTAQCTALGCSFSNGSTDADGTLEAYAWDFGDESAPATTRDATHTYAGPGHFTVSLTVTDDDGDVATATSAVSVTAPGDPGDDLAASFSVSCLYLACEFTDRSAAGPGASFSWSFGDNSEVMTTRDVSHVYPGEGQYRVTLIVTVGGDRAVTSQLVSVEPLNNAPQADFIYSCTDLTCGFSDRSTDESGPLEGYHHWSFGDGTVSTDPNPSHTYAATGEYQVELKVTDMGGATAIASAGFTLPATGQPTAELEIYCYLSRCGLRTVSTGDAIVAWRWRFGDGGTSTEEHPSHTYFVPGTYTVEVTINDVHGGSATLTGELTVPILLQAAFTADCHRSACTFTDESTGLVAQKHWEFGDRSGSDDWNPTHVYQITEETTFRVSLEIWDYDIGYSKKTAEVTVSP